MSEYRLVFRRTGGAEVIEREPVELAQPGPGEARVRHEAIGLNFIDIYFRTGLYPQALPSGLGMEAAGLVEAVGEDVRDFRVGDRVAYAGRALGSYATSRTISASLLVKLPSTIDAETAAAALLKGMTADNLVGPCAKVQPGQTALVLAASGGVGSILVQWLKAIGAIVIAHAGTDAKAARAQKLGADHALSCPIETLATEVRALTGGRGVDVVFDGVGAASWATSLAATAKLGLIVSYGNASGPVPPVAPLELGRAGSLFLTRFNLFDYIAEREALTASAARLFGMIERGQVHIEIGGRFPLSEAAEAHRALEARETTGSILLIP